MRDHFCTLSGMATVQRGRCLTDPHKGARSDDIAFCRQNSDTHTFQHPLSAFCTREMMLVVIRCDISILRPLCLPSDHLSHG